MNNKTHTISTNIKTEIKINFSFDNVKIHTLNEDDNQSLLIIQIIEPFVQTKRNQIGIDSVHSLTIIILDIISYVTNEPFY